MDFIKKNDIISSCDLTITDLKKKLTDGNLIITENSFKNEIKINDDVVLEDTKISLNGSNNTLIIESGSKLYDCCIFASGNNNTIYIGKNCRLKGTFFMCIDNDNSIVINEDCTTAGEFWGNVYFHTMEGTKIEVGSDCMFSGNIVVRTTDGHSIINEEGIRINQAKDIIIGEHVWIGMNCMLLKGTNIKKGCIIGANSVVNKSFSKPYRIIAGNPAKLIKKEEEFDWKREKKHIFNKVEFRN